MLQSTKNQTAVQTPHKPARPMVVVTDEKGSRWLCDKGIDPKKDLSKQGCWNCGDLAFNRND
ncbi:MAG: hypothetical protein JXR73_01235 [Candidatus Omnitrophica bacterium]|nr:hypothetical protein [Candidatus Omnitrophota bacterium]